MPSDISKPFEDYCYTLDRMLMNSMYGFKWRKNDEDTWNIIGYEYEFFIRPEIQNLVQKGIISKSGAIQAGGNCGVYPLALLEFFKTVITFEPNPINFHCLVNNCQNPRIIKINAAVGHKTGRVNSVEVAGHNYGMSKIEEVDTDYYFPMVTIDSFDLTDIGLIQLDTEGFEYNALLGAEQTIKKNRPVIILESLTEQITKYLDSLDYVLYKQLDNKLDYIIIPKEKMNGN